MERLLLHFLVVVVLANADPRDTKEEPKASLAANTVHRTRAADTIFTIVLVLDKLRRICIEAGEASELPIT